MEFAFKFRSPYPPAWLLAPRLVEVVTTFANGRSVGIEAGNGQRLSI